MIRHKLSIGSMELDGRIVLPPMATYKCDEDGHVTDEVCNYYAARAANPHVALIITEHSFFTLPGKARERQMAVSDDACIPGLRKLTDAIHRSGAKAVSQLNHAGAAAMRSVTGTHAVAPSAVTLPVRPPLGDPEPPKALTKEEIAALVSAYAAAALRAKEAGYDGVEIHSAHAYLLNTFYSPLTNLRTDEYGGCLENRLRFHCEVVSAVREAVGSAYPILLRLGACDYADGGNTPEDAARAAAILEKAGIDVLDVSGGMCRYTREGREEPGYFRDAAEAIKKAVSVPVILTGGVKTLSDAETLLRDGVCDLVGVGRALLKDPNWERSLQL